jgi:ASC-1-like (ASCH) protein
MKLLREFFELVINGKKTCEGRFGKRDLDVGEEIAFECDNDQVKAIIVEITFYTSFEAMLQDNLEELLPGYDMVDALAMYNKIYKEKLLAAEEKKEPIIVTSIKFELI